MVPLVIGWLGGKIGLRYGMMFLYLTLGYLMIIGFLARPHITNATILNKRQKEGNA